MSRDYEKIALEDDAREALLDGASVMRFASVGEDGLPHVVPVAFARVGGYVSFETDADSIKTRNVEATGKAAAVIDAGAAEYSQHRGILWRGEAFVIDDRAVEKEIERALFGTVKSVPDASGHERVKIGPDPRTEVSWDFRRLAP